jgi:HAD superfamily hydrolase (TIGR01548 family)
MKALIFDMDGVLVDVRSSYMTAIKKTVENISGTAVSDKDIQDLKDKGGFNNDWVVTDELLRIRGYEMSFENVIVEFQKIYKGESFDGLINSETWLLDKVLIEKISKVYKLAIITGRPRPETEHTLKINGMTDYFESVITMDDQEEQKPDHKLIEITLDRLQCVSGFYFGDTVDDMHMALKSEFVKAVGVLPPGYGKEVIDVLIKNGADIVLENINDLEQVFSE